MAEETSSLNGEEDESNQLKLCVLCATDLKDKRPKLLSCLHSLCENCLNSLFQLQVQQQAPENSAAENNNDKNEPKTSTILCPACNCKVEKQSVMDNLFVSVEIPIVIEEDEEEKEEEPICAGCDENQKVKATSFCIDCREYLCDECVHAHKRVRITKDHTITPKDEVKKDEDSPDTSTQKMMYCQTHKHEPLKLFCETCDKLTCRDCQLLEHKDHKYQFLREAITHQRENLQNAVVSLKNKLGNYKQANEILKSKHSELHSRMVEETQKIVTARDKVMEQFKKYTDDLVEHLEKYVSNKTTIISEKQRLVADALLKMQHAVDFVEHALTIGDDVSILYTKGAMVKNLKQLSESGIPFQPSFLNYSISYTNDIDTLINNKYKLGTLQIDGSWFPPKNAPHPHPPVHVNPVVSQPIQIRPNRFQNSTHMQLSQAAINQQIREKIRHLPPEQQRMYEVKFREKYRIQQIQQQQAQQNAQQQAQLSRSQNNSIIQNQLNNHMMTRPPQHGPPNRAILPQHQSNQFAMSAAGHLASLSQRQSPQPPPYRHIAPAPGAQAAAYANKTPSPAGAGFDHQSGGASQPAPIDQLQAWASQTGQIENHQKYKQEYKQEQRSSCALSSNPPKTQSTPPTSQPAQSASVTHTPTGPVYPPSTGKSMPQSKEEDPNEDWCAVCQNGGDLLCCDKCPKVFHLKCHVPELSQFPCGEWQCTLCKKEEEMVMKEKENKEFSYIPGTKRKAPTGLTDHERKTCERILLELYTHEKSTVFHEPVSKAVPNYYKIITNPIDFSKIKVKLQRQNFNHYDTIEDFIADVKLVFQNCATYNSSVSEIGIAGKMVEEEFERLIQKYLPCYMDIYDEIHHRQSTSPVSDSDSSKSKKSKSYEHDPTVSINLH